VIAIGRSSAWPAGVERLYTAVAAWDRTALLAFVHLPGIDDGDREPGVGEA